MLKNIKSFYILKQIFGNIKYKKKLKLIKYDKELSKKIDITLQTYKEEFFKEFNSKFDTKLTDLNNQLLNLKNKKVENTKLDFLSRVKFESLKALFLNNNEINEIKSLENVSYKSIKYLNLSGNKITDIEPITKANFIELKILYLMNNEISEIKRLDNPNFKKLKN